MAPLHNQDMPAPGTDTRARGTAWHSLSIDATFAEVGSTPRGLDGVEVETRQQRYGRNVLPVRTPPTLAAILLHQFLSPLIYILLAAAAVAIALGDLPDAIFIPSASRCSECRSRATRSSYSALSRHSASTWRRCTSR